MMLVPERLTVRVLLHPLTIHYVRADVGDPMVLSIRRASDPLLPVTAATENVIILLSEKPKAFTKDHVDVTNATWVDPVALVAVT